MFTELSRNHVISGAICIVDGKHVPVRKPYVLRKLSVMMISVQAVQNNSITITYESPVNFMVSHWSSIRWGMFRSGNETLFSEGAVGFRRFEAVQG